MSYTANNEETHKEMKKAYFRAILEWRKKYKLKIKHLQKNYLFIYSPSCHSLHNLMHRLMPPSLQ